MHQGLFYSLGFRDTTTGSEESLLHVVSKVTQKPSYSSISTTAIIKKENNWFTCKIFWSQMLSHLHLKCNKEVEVDLCSC